MDKDSRKNTWEYETIKIDKFLDEIINKMKDIPRSARYSQVKRMIEQFVEGSYDGI